MSARRLQAKAVERTWGRMALPAGFGQFETGRPLGELWHAPPECDAAELLVKHLFSAERLSIQVHPSDADAAARGLTRGKDEAWFILDAEPGASIALGLKAAASEDELRHAAMSGAIEQLMDWRPVEAGDFIFAPAGTIHAIGGGISLIEIQQHSDVTYRLYDYGRPRELHLDDGLAVARREPWQDTARRQMLSARRTVLLAGPSFVVERWLVDAPLRFTPPKAMLAIPLTGDGEMDGAAAGSGQVWSIDGPVEIRSDEAMTLLVAYAGAEIMRDISL